MNAFHQTGLTQKPDPKPTGVAMQHLAATEALLSRKEVVQGTQDHRVDYAISIINRNQRNQSMPAPIQTGDHLKQPSSKWIDYSDYADYDDASDYTHSSSEQDHRVDYAISVISRNQRNQSDLSCSQATLRFEVPNRSGDVKQVLSAI